ncbi:MAG: NAD(P)-dependent oxidoreductase [Gemmatimonadetes bacterium]|jgi:nucleoside-diphosphate-sugar epimerase|nr:NAD(P)-dependent oxidoreductase [Gemmatimonadota bacterium]MBT6149151.1 NAD(P)-dependent oxidoreductase [Gemmatimonadota bacterium]MBT7863936.1 NAD(P)-dependent oxidoreductase [Gemmatimonadota bacterium]
MKKVVFTGVNGQVAYAMQKELTGKYDTSGISIKRMDEILQNGAPSTWKEQMDAYRELLMEQMTTAFRGATAVVHLGWNTRDDNCGQGMDPLNLLAVDCCYQAAIAEDVARIYMASSVHSYDFTHDLKDDVESVKPFPDVRENPFGVPPTSLYGVSKRWMEISGQFYAQKLSEAQKILVVRLGAVGREDHPHRAGSRLWNSHRDLAGLLEAFIECEDAPNFWVAFGVSDNYGEQTTRGYFDSVNPYGYVSQDNSYDH